LLHGPLPVLRNGVVRPSVGPSHSGQLTPKGSSEVRYEHTDNSTNNKHNVSMYTEICSRTKLQDSNDYSVIYKSQLRFLYALKRLLLDGRQVAE